MLGTMLDTEVWIWSLPVQCRGAITSETMEYEHLEGKTPKVSKRATVSLVDSIDPIAMRLAVPWKTGPWYGINGPESCDVSYVEEGNKTRSPNLTKTPSCDAETRTVPHCSVSEMVNEAILGGKVAENVAFPLDSGRGPR